MSKVVQALLPSHTTNIDVSSLSFSTDCIYNTSIYICIHVLKIISFALYNRLGHKLYEINCFVDMLHAGFEILCKSLH